MKKTALIMAGGRGERFWPKSRKNLPKQFLDLTGDGKSMIRQTVERILPMVGFEDIFVSTNEAYRALIREQIPELPEGNIICEPVGRNTAPCIGLASEHMKKKYDDAVMIVLPSDHLIKYRAMFLGSLRSGCELAEKGSNIVTIGITPSYPETGYGYIHFDQDRFEDAAFSVREFVEKPDFDKAKQYIEAEEYLWNSGMFIWKISTIQKNIARLLPEMDDGLNRIYEALGSSEEQSTIKEAFGRMESISVDYGILEKADDIFTIPGTFGWDDVGSWLAVSRLKTVDENGNIRTGNVVMVDTKNCIIEAGEKMMALVGMEDSIVVDTDDATLVCKKDSAGDIRKVIDELKRTGKEAYL